MPYVNEFKYIAVKPLRAEHPVGSGIIVEYAPGEEIPAGEWGRAADNLTELGKAVRTAVAVWVEDGSGGGPPAAEPSAPVTEANGDEPAKMEEQVYPLHKGAAWYVLSDGSQVRGKANAEAAQAALGGVT